MDDVASLEVRWIQGCKNKSVVFVDNKTIGYICGVHLCFLDLDTNTRRVLQSPGRGIGALTANGNGRIFAFSEQKLLPSIFVYTFPELMLKNELKGGAQLDYTSLTLSNAGPYLGSCSSLPDQTITIWNWENAEPICTQPQPGQDVISLTFNPLNWLQLCALDTTSLTVWNIEKSASYHALKPSVIELPATDGTFDEKQTYTSHTSSGQDMPVSAISGLKGDVAESVVDNRFVASRNNVCPFHVFTQRNLRARARLTATAICWTATSQLYVGSAEGFLLLVDPESASARVLFNPTAADAIPELKQSSFQGLTVCKSGLIVVGKENLVHCLQIKKTQISITKTWHVEESVSTVMYSPDFESVLLSSDKGQIYILNPAQSDNVVKVANILGVNFVAAALLYSSKSVCVTVTDSGELQLCSEDGVCLGSLSLGAQGASLACCPVAQYVAVGTTSGKVLFVDLNKEQQPRAVHQVLLYHSPVDHLVQVSCIPGTPSRPPLGNGNAFLEDDDQNFDQEGEYLLTGASDSHVFVLDAKPSNMFSVIGYAEVPGSVLSLSIQCVRDCGQVRALVLCSGQEGKGRDGSLLTMLTLPSRSHAGPDCVDQHGRLSAHMLRVSRYEVPDPVTSCVLGLSEVFAYCHRRKTLQRFQLPQDTDDLTSEQAMRLQPEQEVKGHPLGPATLVLSPHRLWLASGGRDGRLRIREITSMEKYIELQCHSCRLGGVGTASFSVDCQTLITAGLEDGSLVCTNLRTKGPDAEKVMRSCLVHSVAHVFGEENLVLMEMPDWGQSEDYEVSEETDRTDATAQCDGESYPPAHSTWLDRRHQAVIKEDDEQLSETKTNLRETIKELQDTIQEMIIENEKLPDTEHLERHEFNLDVEEQKKLEAIVEKEVSRVRKEIELGILTKCYLHDVLKRECWDSIKFKGRATEAFHSELMVKNYPLKERTKKEMEALRSVHNVRQIENAASSLNSLNKSSTASGAKEGNKEESAALTASFSSWLGYSNPYVYDQLSLITTEQRINQIILLQDVIYRIKAGFNAEFEAVHKQKMQELNRVRDRNRHIRDIMLLLDMNEKLWEPDLSSGEWPERMLTVEDSEIKAEKHLTPEQKREAEEKLNEQRRLAAKGDNSRERALIDMMDGVLEVKQIEILKMEIPPPEFVLTKSEIDWSEEEKRVYKEFEKKTKELNEEKDKYKKLLETEIRKLQAATKDGTEVFDETLTKLSKKRVRCELAIYQEELKIAHLVCSILTQEEMTTLELELKLKLDKMLAYKDEIAGDLKRHEEELELFQETFDGIVAEDNVLDKEFRKEFFDVPTHVVDLLYKLFKRRPRVQKVRTQSENNSNPFRDQRLCGSLAPDALGNLLKAMEELDAPENMPEDLNPSIWERFCLVRRTKVESEQKVKVKALTLAEIQSFLQKKKDEEKAAQQEIKNLSDILESMHKEKNRFQTDIMLQIILKQGQAEVSTTDLTADFTDSVLQHRSVAEELNTTIRTLAEQMIASMVERKDFRKGIIQLEWENTMRQMQIEDLNNKAREIQKLQLTEEQQDFLQKTDQDSRVSKQVSILEKTIGFQEETHQQSVQHRIKTIEQLNKQSASKSAQNAVLDEQLQHLQVSVAERKNVYEETASEKNEAAKTEQRYQEILQKKSLVNSARAQAEELVFSSAELKRLRMKNFPSLEKLQHN